MSFYPLQSVSQKLFSKGYYSPPCNNLSLFAYVSLTTLFLITIILTFSQPNDMRNYPKDLHNKETGMSFKSSNNRNNKANAEVTKDDRSSISDQAFNCSASSVDSIPSASGSSKR